MSCLELFFILLALGDILVDGNGADQSILFCDRGMAEFRMILWMPSNASISNSSSSVISPRWIAWLPAQFSGVTGSPVSKCQALYFSILLPVHIFHARPDAVGFGISPDDPGIPIQNPNTHRKDVHYFSEQGFVVTQRLLCRFSLGDVRSRTQSWIQSREGRWKWRSPTLLYPNFWTILNSKL